MFQEYKSLSEEELDTKMSDILKKINVAHSMGLEDAVNQLQNILEMLQFELTERLERQRFDIISNRTPESLVVGEDEDDPDED
ncbi:hypothetical protein N9I00_01170 [bacterium]|nr:hypothetical protein [bacterium]